MNLIPAGKAASRMKRVEQDPEADAGRKGRKDRGRLEVLEAGRARDRLRPVVIGDVEES